MGAREKEMSGVYDPPHSSRAPMSEERREAAIRRIKRTLDPGVRQQQEMTRGQILRRILS